MSECDSVRRCRHVSMKGMTDEEEGTAVSDWCAATKSAARLGSARRSWSSKPSSVMPRSRSRCAVSGVTQT